MATKRQIAAIELYANLMAEIKVRTRSIETACSGQTGIPSPLVMEFCYLQLRMICELIALGCLTAHGDIKGAQTSKFAKEYSADRILSMLEKLHPDFYPKPVKHTKVGPSRHQLVDIKDGFMTKAELLRLNTKCGAVLHRGSVKKLLTDNMSIQANYPEIMGTVEKIVALLRDHRLLLLGGQIGIICALELPTTGKVQVAIAEAQEE